MYKGLSDFYNSKEWTDFRKVVLAERMKDDGFVYDELTGKPLSKAYDIILHHITELTEENVHDASIALNPENIMVVSFGSHNKLHKRAKHSEGGFKVRQVFLVYGSPLSGKTSFVMENMTEGDLVIDMDSIWECISAQDRYIKPRRLNMVAFKIRDTLIDCIKYRVGNWNAAWLIGGYPLQSERDRLCRELGARPVFIDVSKEVCLDRLKGAGRDEEAWTRYIDAWFDRYRATVSA